MDATPCLDRFIDLYKDTAFCLCFTNERIKDLKDGHTDTGILLEIFKTLRDNASRAYQVATLVKTEIWSLCSPHDIHSFTNALKMKVNGERLNHINNANYRFFSQGEYWSETLTELRESGLITQQDEDNIRTYISDCAKWLNLAINKLKSILDAYGTAEISIEDNSIPKELQTEAAKNILDRCIQAGYLDNNLMPCPSTKKVELKLIALYASAELGIKKKWKVFQDLWKIDNLAQVRELDMSDETKEAVQNLFSSEVISKANLK